MGAWFCSLYRKIHYIEVRYIKDLTCPILRYYILQNFFMVLLVCGYIPVPLLAKYLVAVDTGKALPIKLMINRLFIEYY